MLLHIVDKSEWEAALELGVYTPTTIVTEGFIHLSTPEQVLLPANSFYRGRSGLVLLVIDENRLTSEVRFEDMYGHGSFPHLYGPLNLDAVTAVLPFEPVEDGTFSLPDIPDL